MRESIRADVVIVGAGPAGATAARTLAEAGITTVLLDRSSFPRHKPCGGAVSVRALERFPYLRQALARTSTHWISRLQLESPSGSAVEIRSSLPAALMIRRVEFDAMLVDLAREAGAAVYEGADVVAAEEAPDGVTVTARDGRRFSGRCLVACDGVHSVTARRLGLAGAWPRASLAVDMMEETPHRHLRPVEPDLMWVRYGCPAPRNNGGAPLWEGYAYLFPKREHVNVGIGYLLPAYRAAAQGPAYTSQLALVTALRDRGLLTGASRHECFTPFLIPVRGPRRVLARGRVLLAGDAGGFVHGVTAEGIYYAMVSGQLAARAIAAALSRAGGSATPDLSGYAAACRVEIGAELRDGVRLQDYLFADPRRVEAALEAARRRPELVDDIVAFLMGRGPYRRLRARMAGGSPALVLMLAAAAVRGRVGALVRAR